MYGEQTIHLLIALYIIAPQDRHDYSLCIEKVISKVSELKVAVLEFISCAPKLVLFFLKKDLAFSKELDLYQWHTL